jgi:hypothetical protein
LGFDTFADLNRQVNLLIMDKNKSETGAISISEEIVIKQEIELDDYVEVDKDYPYNYDQEKEVNNDIQESHPIKNCSIVLERIQLKPGLFVHIKIKCIT